MNNYIFLADGFEEIEALAVVDLLRRAGMSATTVSINETPEATGAHGIPVIADTTIDCISCDYDWLILPGGLPGAPNLAACEKLTDMLVEHNNAGKHIAAICASPAMVLAPLGILEGKEATCYPGLEDLLTGAVHCPELAVASKNVVTGKGPAAAMAFALEIIKITLGEDKANEVAAGLLYC